MSDLSFFAKKRYTTKAFDPTKTIPADKISEIKPYCSTAHHRLTHSLGILC